jgi:hypothetical protein
MTAKHNLNSGGYNDNYLPNLSIEGKQKAQKEGRGRDEVVSQRVCAKDRNRDSHSINFSVWARYLVPFFTFEDSFSQHWYLLKERRFFLK